MERETAGLSGGGGGSGNVSVLIGGADDGGAGPPAQLLPRAGGQGAGATGAFGGSRPVSTARERGEDANTLRLLLGRCAGIAPALDFTALGPCPAYLW